MISAMILAVALGQAAEEETTTRSRLFSREVTRKCEDGCCVRTKVAKIGKNIKITRTRTRKICK